ncbi:50S ribosomal protein L25, partial [Burkholderia sp. Tr-860]|nr:50S ribosomal protein L25 [Burkholderia sp. Tr-860]
MPRVRSLLAVSLSAVLALPPGSHAQSSRPAQAASSPVVAASPAAG